MSVYVAGPNVSAATPSASVSIDLNGTRIGALRFHGIVPDYPINLGKLAPANVIPSDIPVTPLFSTRAIVFPVKSSSCKLGEWTIRISTRSARWQIERVGILAHFTPASRGPDIARLPTLVFAAIIVLALLAVSYALFERVERGYGKISLLLVVGMFACALITHDEWDFPVWLRFVDLAELGHTNPALMWGGLPLWPLTTALLAPVLSSVYVLTGSESQEVVALLLKLAMALAVCGNALFLTNLVKPALRRFLFPIVLLAPSALYELAGGYREPFAGSFFLLGAWLARNRRFTIATIAFAAATSISESLFFAMFLPATLRLASARIELPSLGRAIGDVAAGLAVLAFEVFFLEPTGVIANTISARLTTPYRLGGGTWLATVDGFSLLPSWISEHSAPFTLVLLTLLLIPPVISIVANLGSREVDNENRTKRLFGDFIAIIAAFFLSYHGIDPSTWYTLWIATAYYFLRFEPLSPFPFFLSVLQGFAFYAILGIQDFANATYVVPTNHALLGVLGRPMLIGILTVNIAIGVLYISRMGRASLPLFGRGSFQFAMLFFFAIAAAAVKMYPIDIIFCCAAGVAILGAFSRLARLDGRHSGWRRNAVIDYIGLGTAVVAGTWGGTQNPAAALVAFVAILLGIAYGFSMCDVVLVLGATLIVGTQYGFGWVSIAGYIGLSLMAVFAIGFARSVAPTEGKRARSA